MWSLCSRISARSRKNTLKGDIHESQVSPLSKVSYANHSPKSGQHCFQSLATMLMRDITSTIQRELIAALTNLSYISPSWSSFSAETYRTSCWGAFTSVPQERITKIMASRSESGTSCGIPGRLGNMKVSRPLAKTTVMPGTLSFLFLQDVVISLAWTAKTCWVSCLMKAKSEGLVLEGVYRLPSVCDYE